MNVIDWLLKDDLFTVYHVEKYLLLNFDKANEIKKNLKTSDFAKTIIFQQDLNTSLWGGGVYSPKYTSTHYSLLTLCELEVDLSESRFLGAIDILLNEMWARDGKVNKYRHQDMCVVAMMIRICAQANVQDNRIFDMIDYVIDHRMNDGGWNCAWERKPYPKQSSLHTTLSVLEAFYNLLDKKYNYRVEDIKNGILSGSEYMLSKRLFKSVRTNQIIHNDMLKFPFPYGWKYDILRALYVMANLDISYDERMKDAISIIIDRLDDIGRIKADSLSVGKHYKIYRKANTISPFNSFRALRVLKKYKLDSYLEFINRTCDII